MRKFSLNTITVFCALLLIGFSASCSKTKDLALHVNNIEWYLTTDNFGSGDVHLKISGSTSGNEVIVLLSPHIWLALKLDPKKNFNSDFVFAFFAKIPDEEFEIDSEVLATKENDTLKMPLNSGKLKF